MNPLCIISDDSTVSTWMNGVMDGKVSMKDVKVRKIHACTSVGQCMYEQRMHVCVCVGEKEGVCVCA